MLYRFPQALKRLNGLKLFLLLTLAAAIPMHSDAQIGNSLLNTSSPVEAGTSSPAYARRAANSENTTVNERAATAPMVRVNVTVTPGQDLNATGGATAYHVSSAEILRSAGTYGDFSRYLQMFPGVTFNSDVSDDVLVRGGNPIENLYRIDGIDIPNINHIATQGTTGGLVSMIDTSAIEGLDFLASAYDASYDERLSSVIDIHTREPQAGSRFTQADVGFVGAGITTNGPLSQGGSYLLSAHRSLLNLFTDDIGLNGVPIYTNALMRLKIIGSPTDTFSILSVGGIDSIKIKPECLDVAETNTINTQYKGWRETTGLRWQHLYSANNLEILTISDSEDHKDIKQQDQLFNGLFPPMDVVIFPGVPVYSEATHDGIRTFKYEFSTTPGRLSLSSGVELHSHRIVYNVVQPVGAHSPLSADPNRSDATSFAPILAVLETGEYAQFSYHLTDRWTMGAGFRHQNFAEFGHQTFTPRWNTSYAISSHLNAHLSYGEYAQNPPYIYILAFSQNQHLTPMRDQQMVAGIDAQFGSVGGLKLEAFRKDYTDYPVSSEYPTLSLSNIVDTLGQEFIWIPMVSSGRGRASGVELSGQAHLGSHFYAAANVAVARDKFAGLDGVLRPGNFDYPVVVNAAGTYSSGRRYEASYRYEYTTGRPYTPFLLSASAAQNRPIYDMTQVNSKRGPAYSRLDFSVTRNFSIREGTLSVYGGLENALDRQNFLGYAWMPRVDALWPDSCKTDPASCATEETQMGIFPNFGARFRF